MGTYPPGWGSGSGEHGAAADAARASSAAAKKKKSAAGSPDAPGEAEAKLRAAGVSEADIKRGYSLPSKPGQPDRPGEATAKMISAGVMTPAGQMKDIVGYYKDPTTGLFRFAAKGEPLPTVPQKPAERETEQLQQAIATRGMQPSLYPAGLVPRGDMHSLRPLRPEYTSGTAYQYDRPYKRVPTVVDISMRKLAEYDVAVSKKLPFQPDPFTVYTQYFSDIGKPFRDRYATGKMPVAVKSGMEFVRGGSETVWKKPVTTGITAAAFYVAPPLIAGATGLASGLPVVGAAAPAVTKIALTGMGGLYAYGAGKRILAPIETDVVTTHEGVPSMAGGESWHTTTERVTQKKTFPQMMHTAGGIFSGEILPMGVGARLATRPPPVPKVSYDPSSGIARLRIGKQFDVAVGKAYTTYQGGRPTRYLPSARVEIAGRSRAIGGEIAKPPVDFAQTSYRGLKLKSTPEVIALEAKMRTPEAIEPPRVTGHPLPVYESTYKPPSTELILGGRRPLIPTKTPVEPAPSQFAGRKPPEYTPRKYVITRNADDLALQMSSPRRIKPGVAPSPVTPVSPHRVSQFQVTRAPKKTRIAAEDAAMKASKTARLRAKRAKALAEDIASRPERLRAQAEAHARRVEDRVIRERGDAAARVPVVPLLTQGKRFRVTKKKGSLGLKQSEAAQTTMVDVVLAPRIAAQEATAAARRARDWWARPSGPRQGVRGRQKLSPAMMQLMRTSQVQRVSQVQTQYQPQAVGQAYKQALSQDVSQTQKQDQAQVLLPIFGQAQAQRIAQAQKQFQVQRIKTPTYTTPKTPPITPTKAKKKLPPEPKPKPFVLPKIKADKAKKKPAKKKPAEVDYWQIRNPIASIEQMMFGGVKR